MTDDGVIKTKEIDILATSNDEAFSNKLLNNTLACSKKNIDEVEPFVIYQFFYATDD